MYKKQKSSKPKVSQLQRDWLAMEMQVMRELCKSINQSEN